MDTTALAALFLASAVNAALPGPCADDGDPLRRLGLARGRGGHAGVLTADILLIWAQPR